MARLMVLKESEAGDALEKVDLVVLFFSQIVGDWLGLDWWDGKGAFIADEELQSMLATTRDRAVTVAQIVHEEMQDGAKHWWHSLLPCMFLWGALVDTADGRFCSRAVLGCETQLKLAASKCR